MRLLPVLIALAVAPSAAYAAGGGTGLCRPGQPVEVEWQSQWWAGHVLDGPMPDGSCYITYDGWHSSWDEWVTPYRLRAAGSSGFASGSGLCMPGWPVRIEWQGQWWAGHVLQGPAGDGTCYISYDGYDANWDEWVTPDRLAPAG